MEPYQARAFAERRELAERINQLAFFLDTERCRRLPENEQRLLALQLQHMNAYFEVLCDRITAWVLSE